MNILLPGAAELKAFQIEHYSEMLLKPRNFEHKIFLRKQIKLLKDERIFNTRTDNFYRVLPLFRGFHNNWN